MQNLKRTEIPELARDSTLGLQEECSITGSRGMPSVTLDHRFAKGQRAAPPLSLCCQWMTGASRLFIMLQSLRLSFLHCLIPSDSHACIHPSFSLFLHCSHSFIHSWIHSSHWSCSPCRSREWIPGDEYFHSLSAPAPVPWPIVCKTDRSHQWTFLAQRSSVEQDPEPGHKGKLRLCDSLELPPAVARIMLIREPWAFSLSLRHLYCESDRECVSLLS